MEGVSLLKPVSKDWRTKTAMPDSGSMGKQRKMTPPKKHNPKEMEICDLPDK